MELVIEELKKEVSQLKGALHNKNLEVNLLQSKVQYLLQKLFGKKTEKLNPYQLQLLLQGLEPSSPPEDDDPPPPDPNCKTRKRRKRVPRPAKLPKDLPVEEVRLEPKEVLENPDAYRCIGEEVLEELDVTPTKFFRRRIIRPKYVKIEDREHPPIIVPSPKRLIENSFASVGLLVYILLSKYVDHLPLYRQEKIFKTRHGIDLSRKTMSDWVWKIGNWFRLIYEEMKDEIRDTHYLQVDETPIRYLKPGMGKSLKGYLWVYHAPGVGVVFEWHKGRGADCLKNMLDPFKGKAQTDGYSAYLSYAKDQEYIEWLACWAHVRRMFFDATGESTFAAWILIQIQNLYRVEKKLRQQKAGSVLRAARRQSESKMIVNRIGKALRKKLGAYRPKTLTGKAINYALNLWSKLTPFLDLGQVEIGRVEMWRSDLRAA